MSFQGMTNQFGNMGFGGPPQPDNNYGGYGQYSANQGGPPPPQPSYQPPSDKPPLPQGWTPYFDQQHQRWFYVEESTGRTQWEAPGYSPPPMQSPPVQSPPAQGGYGPPAGPPPPGGAYNGDGQGQTKGDKKEKKGSGAGGLLLGAAGGLAAGAIGGAVLHHALHGSDSDSSDDEKPHHSSYAAPAAAEAAAPSVTNIYHTEYVTYNEPPPAMYAADRYDSDPLSIDGQIIKQVVLVQNAS
ncbi:hypothetical protein VCV18_001900 [Metarhizium anisopliae]